MMDGKKFVLGCALIAVGSALAGRLPADKVSVLRFGVMTDTHVGKTVKSCVRVRQALELFREQGVALVVNNGDIANRHWPEGYRAYRQVFEEVYRDVPRPQELYAYAWHDACSYLGHPREQVVADAPQAFEDVRKHLKAPNGHTAELRLGGYTFLVMPQFTGSKGFISWAEYERRVAEACKANPGKPVFVIDHVPPSGTVYYSVQWGCDASRRILDKYPQVVALTGHVHGSILSDRFIWQKDFTVVNAGCLCGWDGLLAGRFMTVPGGFGGGCDKQEWGVLTVNVHPDCLVIRRWDVRDRREVAAPWIVPLPFVAATAPHRWERQRAAAAKPAFAPGAKVTAVPVEKDGVFVGFQVDFTDSAKDATTYRIVAERRRTDGIWGERALCELFSDYSYRAADRRASLRYGMPAAYFTPSSDYRVSVIPVNPYGVTGSAISTQVKTPAVFAPGTVVWTCDDPMKSLPFFAQRDKPVRVVGADGFYGPLPDSTAHLVLPAGLFAGPTGTHYRLVVDVRTVCDSVEQQPMLGLVRKGMSGGGRRGEYNGFGDMRSLRFMEVTAGSQPIDYDLELWGAAGGKVRFESLRLLNLR